MKKEIRSDLILFVLNLMAIFFIANPGILNVQIPVGNFYLYLSSLIAAFLVILYVSLKNNNKVNLILNITNLELPRIITIFV